MKKEFDWKGHKKKCLKTGVCSCHKPKKIIIIEHNCSSDKLRVCLLADEIRNILKEHYKKDKLKIRWFDGL